MFVLGVDPGVSRCGYGLVASEAQAMSVVSAGVITTPVSDPLPQRLAELSAELEDLITEYRPNIVVVERVFFQTNVRTAMSVGQASGLALALAHKHGAEVVQYTSNEVKQCVTGDGAATKAQTQRMVQQLLSLPERPDPPDVADALALAICHISQYSWRTLIKAHS